MNKPTSAHSLPITDLKGRNMLVDVMLVYPVGGLQNEAKDNPFYLSVTSVVYLNHDITKFISKPGFKELENEAERILVNEGLITVYNQKAEL